MSSHKDTRELVETVVFVLVLVNILRMFGAEAFVIPTGSMATTLRGAHKAVTCPQCGYRSTVNASQQVEDGQPAADCYCQNCRFGMRVIDVAPSGGDRVLVGKFLYEGLVEPKRWDVVVFKCPATGKARINYIKRLVGLPNETVKIRNGDIHVRPDGESEFRVASKPPRVVQAVRRLVFDNNHQPEDLAAAGVPPRWRPAEDGGFTAAQDGRSFTSAGDTPTWLDYHHQLAGTSRVGDDDPQVVSDWESYNSNDQGFKSAFNWVGDLIIDCRVNIVALKGSVVLELVEGGRQYQCVLDLEALRVRLVQNGSVLAESASPVQRTGRWHVEFANVDDRLIVWIEGALVFGEGVPVEPPNESEQGPQEADLRPARIGSLDAPVTVSDLRLFRDLYYTQRANQADYHRAALSGVTLESIRQAILYRGGANYQLGADEFFMLGDNSPASSDGREWEGTQVVPRHLLLGQALIRYWPVLEFGFVE